MLLVRVFKSCFALISLSLTALLVGCANVPVRQQLPTIINQSQLDELLDDARNYLELGYGERAYIVSKLAVKGSPNDLDAKYLLGQSALATNELKEAVDYLSIVQKQRSTADVEGLLGLALVRSGDIGEAKPFLMSSLAADRSQWRIAYSLANIERDIGNNERALELLNLAKIHTDKPALVEEAQGQIYLLIGESLKALELFKSVQMRTEGRMGGGVNYRKALAGSGMIDLALEGVDNTDSAKIHRYLAHRAIEKKQKSEAISYLKQAKLLFPRLDPETEDLMSQALALP